jgi:protein-tyrosine phosphatase
MPLSATDNAGIVQMIDLHAHILSGLDDGPRTLEESIRMCWISYRDGVRTIVATTHTLNGLYINDRETILLKVQELNGAIRKLGVAKPLDSEIRNPQSEMPFRILPGADVRFCEDILHQLDAGKLTTIGDGRHFLSIEFPYQGIPYRAEEVLFQLMTRGIVPIISHPERNLEIVERPKRYYEMIRMGCLGQVTAMSLTGRFGHGIRRVVGRFIKKQLVHIIASDAHSINGRPPVLSEALRAAEKIVAKDEARRMVRDYPQAILEGRRPDVPEPIPP